MGRGIRTQHLTVSGALLWPLVEVIRARSGDLKAALAAAGLGEDTFFSPGTRIPFERYVALWQQAETVARDRAFGVHMAGFTDPASAVSWPLPLSLFEHMGIVSSTLSDAVTLQSRFLRLMRDGMSTALEIDGDEAIFRMEYAVDQPASMVEYDFAIALNLARRVTRGELSPREVWFAHPAPQDITAHARLFRAPLRFDAPWNGIICAAEYYTRALPTANEHLRDRIVRQAEHMLGALPSVDLFEDKVCAQIEAELPGGNTNAAAVAEKLGVSCRTLHRRLQQEDSSYQELLDRVRFRLAVRYLGSGKSIGEVALLVGFAQASTFHRAFKSWTGETPAEFQHRQRNRGVSAVI
jgi:AraC-like DNA-binding protein